MRVKLGGCPHVASAGVNPPYSIVCASGHVIDDELDREPLAEASGRAVCPKSGCYSFVYSHCPACLAPLPGLLDGARYQVNGPIARPVGRLGGGREWREDCPRCKVPYPWATTASLLRYHNAYLAQSDEDSAPVLAYSAVAAAAFEASKQRPSEGESGTRLLEPVLGVGSESANGDSDSAAINAARRVAGKNADRLDQLDDLVGRRVDIGTSEVFLERLDRLASRWGYKWDARRCDYRRAALPTLRQLWDFATTASHGLLGVVAAVGLVGGAIVVLTTRGGHSDQPVTVSVERLSNTSLTPPERSHFNSLVRVSGRLIALGYRYDHDAVEPDAGSLAAVWSVDDNWNVRLVDAANTTLTGDGRSDTVLNGGIDVSGRLMAVGSRSDGTTNRPILVRQGPTDWSTAELPVPADREVVSALGIASGQGTFVIVGTAGRTTSDGVGVDGEKRPVVWTSTDGADWEAHELAGAFEGSGFSGVMYDSAAHRFVAAGWTANPQLTGNEYDPRNGALWTSADGVSWTEASLEPGAFAGFGWQELHSVAQSDNLWIAVGVDDSTDEAAWDGAIWISEDGIAWSRVDDGGAAGGSGSQSLRGLAENGGKWFAAGSAAPPYNSRDVTLLAVRIDFS